MSTREVTEKAAYAAVYHYEKHGELPGRAGDIEDRVTVHRIVKQLRSADLDPSDAERIVDVLRGPPTLQKRPHNKINQGDK